MHIQVGPLDSHSPLVFFQNSNSRESPSLPLFLNSYTSAPPSSLPLAHKYTARTYTFSVSFTIMMETRTSARSSALLPSKLSALLFLLVIAFCTSSINEVQCLYQEKRVVFNLQKLEWKQKSSGGTTAKVSTCLSHKSRWEKGATILELKHRDSCSPGKISDWNKKLQKLLILDDLRVKSLQSRIRNTISGNNINVDDALDGEIRLTSGIRLQTLNYIVAVELGGRKMTVIVDTGSDLTWVQCQPCGICYNQQDPLFNPSSSPSYQPVYCNSTACQSLEYATGNSGVCESVGPPTCNYAVSYGDGSYSRGELGKEDVNLGGTTVKGFIFGCGRNNRGLFGGASGLMGLGRSDLSLISQTSSIFGGVFSYCLPTTEPEASGSLVLGGNSSVYKNTTPISYTTMMPNPQLPTFYFLNLTGITLGGGDIQAPSFGQAGILIDSGTVITRLPPSIYSSVKAEFLKQFSEVPPAPPFSILDTCFNLSRYEEVDIPTLKLRFEGDAELNVDVMGMLYFAKTDASQVCLALASLSYEDEIGIIGNYQQRNQRVIYNTKDSKIGFAGEACNFN